MPKSTLSDCYLICYLIALIIILMTTLITIPMYTVMMMTVMTGGRMRRWPRSGRLCVEALGPCPARCPAWRRSCSGRRC